MTKTEAKQLFDNSIPVLAGALEITRHAIYQWPEELDREKSDRVIGAAVRTGRLVLRKTPNQISSYVQS